MEKEREKEYLSSSMIAPCAFYWARLLIFPYPTCSESSMFISRDRFILKTCGTTTLLRCVNALMYIVTQYTGFHKVSFINLPFQKKIITLLLERDFASNRLILELNYSIIIAHVHSCRAQVRDVFYSRKNYTRPELQDKPHSSFEEEAALLDSIFKEGNAYCLGSINSDCWYLYTLQGHHMNRADQTLELIMQELGKQDSSENK